MDTMRQTDVIRACRNEPIIHPVVTEVALLSNPLLFIEGDGLMGASFKT
jgi:hypothetical protein